MWYCEKDCKKRKPGCHITCKRYKKKTENQREIYEERKRKVVNDGVYFDAKQRGMKRKHLM